mgnify:FL=1
MKTSKILFTRQKHQADRAGFHYDIRLVHGDVAYSWATKKDIPAIGGSIILHEQPVHTASYALSEKVVIPKGNYGAGVTTLDFVRKADLTKNEGENHFILSTPQGERYLLKHIPAYGPKQWLFRNLGPEQVKKAESEGVQEELYPPLPDIYTILTPKPTPPKPKTPVFRITKIAAVAKELLDKFKPDVTPEQMSQLGVLVGKYTEGKPEEGNFFKTDASLKAWPDKWHNEQHPLGWYEWYQGWSKGKRTDDDERQIKRWISFKARHLAQLQKADPTLQDLSVQPRRRQALLNWGIAPGIEKKAIAVEMYQHNETGRKMWAPEGKAPSDRWSSMGKTKNVLAQDGRKFSKDGAIFSNRNKSLPIRPLGYYKEYTLKANSSGNRGPVRMVCGGADPSMPEVCYYTSDHYKSFTKMDMNRYLQKVASTVQMEKVALRRAVAEFAKGKISMKIEEMVRRGVVKSPNTYAKGMRKGNDNIAKQVGGKIMRARGDAPKLLAERAGGYVAIPDRKHGATIITDKKNSVMFPTKGAHQSFIRHELFETMDANAKRSKISNHYKNLPNTYGAFRDAGADHRLADKTQKLVQHHGSIKPSKFAAKIDDKEIPVGTHYSPRVLTRESEMARKNPHVQHILQRVRQGSGEARMIQRITGKQYGVDKMTSKDHRKAFGAKPDGYDDQFGNKVNKFIVNKK